MGKIVSSSRFHKCFYIFTLGLALVFGSGCSDKTGSNIIKNGPGGGNGPVTEKPGQKAQTADVLSIALLASSFSDQLLRRELSLQSVPLDSCIDKDNLSSNPEVLDFRRCIKGQGKVITGGLKLVKTKDASGLQKLEITHWSESGLSPLTLETRSVKFDSKTEITLSVILTRQNSYTYTFVEVVGIKSTRTPENAQKPFAGMTQIIRREGLMQVSGSEQASILSYSSNAVETNFFNEDPRNRKKFTSTLMLSTLVNSDGAGRYVVCGLPQGEQTFVNETDDNGKKLSVTSSLSIKRNEIEVKEGGPKLKLKGVCDGLAEVRLNHLEELIDRKLRRYTTLASAKDEANPNARGRQVRGQGRRETEAPPKPVSADTSVSEQD